MQLSQQEKEDAEELIGKLEEIQELPDVEQLAMINQLLGLFVGLDQDLMADAFRIIAPLDYVERTEALGVFILGMREAVR